VSDTFFVTENDIPRPEGQPTFVVFESRAPRIETGGSSAFLVVYDSKRNPVPVAGTIHDVFRRDGTRHEFVVHGPNAPGDRRAVVAGFLSLDEAITWGWELAQKWVDRYWTPETSLS
jgi:hypothetical protein